MINNDYVYLTIPVKYLPVYKALLVLLVDYGEDMLKDCKASCKEGNVCIVECFNLFNAALSAYELDKIKLADLLIHYIKVKLNLKIEDSDEPEPDPQPEPEPEPQPTTDTWYIGQINKTRPDFAELTVDELLAVSTAYSSTNKTVSITLNSSCWFVMIPTTCDVSRAYYIDGGILTEYNAEEIKNNFGGLVTHSDVVINNKTYKVYVNRSMGFVDSNLEAWFVIK